MKEKLKLILVIILLVAISIPLIYFNIRNNQNFFVVSISSLLTLYLSIFVSYYLVQRNNNKRNQKEIYVKLLTDMQKLVTDPSAYTITSNTSVSPLTTIKRSLNNYICLIEKYSKKFNLENEAAFIENKFSEYEIFIADHLSDINYLSKSRKELKRPLDLINGKLYEMMLKIYE